MIHFSVSILPRAEMDLTKISGWLHKRSPRGAANWLASFAELVDRLEIDPERYGKAPESAVLRCSVHQAIFKTRRGHNYRVVFKIDQSKVFILRVRGPGQPPLQVDEIE